MTIPCVLILAGLDPSGGAGLLADAEAVRALGVRPLCVPTALTVQSLSRARSFEPVAPEYLLAAARVLLEEEEVRAIKLGMLASPAVAAAIATLLDEPRAKHLPLILDPVLAASSGASLFRGSAGPESSLAEARAAVESLWPRALVTPNALEAQLLLGLSEPPQTADALEDAARLLVSRGAFAALVKGGHASGTEAVDVLVERARDDLNPNIWNTNSFKNQEIVSRELGATRLASPRLFREGNSAKPLNARGTGCRFASALAAGIALGNPPLAAARLAKALVDGYLRAEETRAARR